MTDLRTAAQAALEAIEDFDVQCRDRQIFIPAEIDTAIDALRAALREDAMQRVSDIGQEMENAANKPTTPPLRDAAQAALDALNNSDACHYSGVQTAMSELRQGLAADKAQDAQGDANAMAKAMEDAIKGGLGTVKITYIDPSEIELPKETQDAQPVAWVNKKSLDDTALVNRERGFSMTIGASPVKERFRDFPLYTHPAPIGDLSDEEIDKAWRSATIDYTAPYDTFKREVARAIIAAAREVK